MSGVQHISNAVRPGGWTRVNQLATGRVDVVRSNAFTPALPALLPKGFYAQENLMPAIKKWFLPFNGKLSLNQSYLREFGQTSVPLEWTRLHDSLVSKENETSFVRQEAPFSLFLEWAEGALAGKANDRLYLAQVSMPDLPAPMRQDVPTPQLVKHLGKGDVYDSSIWLGVAPTFTPLHRDPNPNLFVQLAGQKTIRLFAKETGDQIFEDIRRILGTGGSAAIRGEEMMQGKEKALLEKLVWEDDDDIEAEGTSTQKPFGFEASLGVGDALFIPKGFWHSVKGVGNGVTGSVRQQ